MKKIIALLLVLCMVFGLFACGRKPVDDPDGTGSSQSTDAGNQGGGGSNDSSNSGGGGQVGGGLINPGGYTGETLSHEGGAGLGGEVENVITSNDDLINPDFAGKSLQIYGFSGAQYTNIDEMGEGNFIWMVRAAIDEWAALNNVTVTFEGDYDQNTILGAINSGAKPDVLIECDRFPLVANLDIVRPLTDAEYEQLAATCGNLYLDMLTYGGECYGFNQPWSGNTLFYYNKTVFEEYGAKTPKEYYMEGNWTWDTMVECFKAVTKDLDGNGRNDTYGCGIYGPIMGPYMWSEAEDGTLSHNLNSQMYKDYLEICYEGNQLEGYLGDYSICTKSTNPRPVTHVGDAEWYNFEHLNQTLKNGDVVEAIFPPVYKNDMDNHKVQYTQCFSSIFTTCDEPEAALSLLTYVLRVGMRYMSEFSCGLYGCEYEGMRGVTAYSLGWRENFQEVVEQRKADFAALEDWDQEMYDKMFSDMLKCDGWINHIYPKTVEELHADEATELPPASSLPLIVARYDAQVEGYNKLYVNNN